MRYALISDVHANLPALEAVLADIDARGDAQAIYHLGDLVGYAPWPNEVVALLRERGIVGIAGNDRPSNLNGWYEAVAEYGGGELYAQEVFETLKSGASATISTGESLQLAPQDVEVPQIYTAQSSAEYVRALWRPAYRGNYTQANRGASWIDFIVIHIAQGSYSGTIECITMPEGQKYEEWLKSSGQDGDNSGLRNGSQNERPRNPIRRSSPLPNKAKFR